MTAVTDIYAHHSDVLCGDVVVWEHNIYKVLNIATCGDYYEYRLMFPHQVFQERDELLVVSSQGNPGLKFRLLRSSTLREKDIDTLV